MRSLAVLVAGIPVLAFAWHALARAYRLAVLDAKETKALRLADEYPPFARALARAQQYSLYLMTADSPWHRPEHGNRAVVILRRPA